MPTLSLRTRWLLGLTGGLVLIAIVLVHTVPFIGMAWGALTGGPGIGLVGDMRSQLLQQEEFRETLHQHEQEAVRRYQATGSPAYQQRHLVRVNLTPFGMPGFHDIFAVRVRTDLVEGEPKTAFLTRPGVVFSEDDEPFFTGQCDGAFCKQTIRVLLGFGRGLMNRGILTPYRLNITESDATSTVSIGPDPIATDTWAEQTRKRHHSGQGHSAAELHP